MIVGSDIVDPLSYVVRIQGGKIQGYPSGTDGRHRSLGCTREN